MKMAPLARALAADFSIQPLAFSLSLLRRTTTSESAGAPKEPRLRGYSRLMITGY